MLYDFFKLKVVCVFVFENLIKLWNCIDNMFFIFYVEKVKSCF